MTRSQLTSSRARGSAWTASPVLSELDDCLALTALRLALLGDAVMHVSELVTLLCAVGWRGYGALGGTDQTPRLRIEANRGAQRSAAASLH